MKINLLLALALLVATFTTTVRAQTVGTDEVAIRKTLDAMRPIFDKHDLNAFTSYFVNSPDLYYQITTIDHQIIRAHGWNNMKNMIGGYFQSVPIVTTPSAYKTTDSHIRVNGNTAVVTEGNDVNGEQSLHFIVLEKAGSIWKISSFLGQSYAVDKLMEVK